MWKMDVDIVVCIVDLKHDGLISNERASILYMAKIEYK